MADDELEQVCSIEKPLMHGSKADRTQIRAARLAQLKQQGGGGSPGGEGNEEEQKRSLSPPSRLDNRANSPLTPREIAENKSQKPAHPSYPRSSSRRPPTDWDEYAW